MEDIQSIFFKPYHEARGDNWYESDTTLKKVLDRHAFSEHHKSKKELSQLGKFAASEMFDLSQEAAKKENEPEIGKNQNITLSPETQKLYKYVYLKKLGFVSSNLFIHYAKLYLMSLNGEAGVCCSLACTDGMERILKLYQNSGPKLKKVYHDLTHPKPNKFYHGAQFVTEIQGGSDVAQNQVKAVKIKNKWKITGLKWFCSNINADYFLITARSDETVSGAKGLSLFLVPRLEEKKTNHFRLRRLKDKLGTRELATAEVDFNGSCGYLVGEEGKGVSLVVGFVLTTSRIHCCLASTAFLRRALIEIKAYTHFRTAFGRPIIHYSLVKNTVQRIEETHQKLMCGLFKLLSMWEQSYREPDNKDIVFDTRILISLLKPFATKKTSALLHDAMMLLAGNGIEEQFSPLPRLLRDSIIYETWEGPHFVLLTQAYKDMKKFNLRENMSAFFKRSVNDENHPLKEELLAILNMEDEQKALLKFEVFAEKFIEAFLIFQLER